MPRVEDRYCEAGDPEQFGADLPPVGSNILIFGKFFDVRQRGRDLLEDREDAQVFY